MPPKGPPPGLMRVLILPPYIHRLPRYAYYIMRYAETSYRNDSAMFPQEAPQDNETESSTSDELYSFSSEDERHAEDAVQHGPWMAREQLPTNMQPQDGAFQETIAEGLSPMDRTAPHHHITTATDISTSSRLPSRDPGIDLAASRPYFNDSGSSDQAGRGGCPPSSRGLVLR